MRQREAAVREWRRTAATRGASDDNDPWRLAGPVCDTGRLTCPGSAAATTGAEEERTEQQWQQGIPKP